MKKLLSTVLVGTMLISSIGAFTAFADEGATTLSTCLSEVFDNPGEIHKCLAAHYNLSELHECLQAHKNLDQIGVNAINLERDGKISSSLFNEINDYILKIADIINSKCNLQRIWTSLDLLLE